MPLVLPNLQGHRVLVVEDDEHCRQTMLDLLTARGDRPRGVATVEEAIRALEEEDFCYIILDQALPFAKGCAPLALGGERLLSLIRAADSRRCGHFHVTPIMAWTSYSTEPDFVFRMSELGADAFATKGGDQARLLEKITTMLARGGRGDHALCAALAPPAKVTPELARAVEAREALEAQGGGEPDVALEIRIDGDKDGPRSPVEINRVARALQDGHFVVLLRAVVAHERAVGSWSDRATLGATGRETMSRVRAAFKGLVPEGFEAIENDRSGRFRLNPRAVVAWVDWEKLESHPHDGVKKIAKSQREWWAKQRVAPPRP